MAAAQGGGGSPFPRSSTNLLTPAPGPPPRDFLLATCRTLNAITALCLVLCAAAFAMALVLRDGVATRDANFVAGQLVRMFGIALSLMAVLIESEWRFVLKLAPLMDIWLARGLFYFFISSLTFREAYPSEQMTDFQKSLQLYRSAASLSLAACAMMYGCGGVCCARGRWRRGRRAVRTARQRREDRLHDAESEFDELERRRRELQRVLGRTAEP